MRDGEQREMEQKWRKQGEGVGEGAGEAAFLG